ncbi:MAG: hypothetical protein V4516_09505 [Pseudomonadota bacterium]
MGPAAIHAMTDRVAQLMEEKLAVRGKGLAAKLRRGGRLLPRQVRSAAQNLVQAADMANSPKLAMQVDNAQVAAAYDACLKHLSALPAAAGWGAHALASLRSIAFAVLVIGAGVIGYMVWRGYV